LTQTPRIALVKTAAVGGTGKVGDVITYTFAVTNTGNLVLSNIVVTDPMIGLTITGNPIATLAIGATNTTIKGTYTITQADIDAGQVVNTALATAKDPKGNTVTDISGSTVTNDTPTTTPLAQNPSLLIVKTATTENYTNVGDVLNYTIKVTNNGNVTLTKVLVTDPLTGLSTTIDKLEPGAFKEYTQSYSVTQNDISNSSVTNIAYVKATTPTNLEVSASDDAVVEAAIVLPCGNIVVHNAFSPNGDGINEVFTIDSITDTTCYPTNTVEIYNRWGVLVYEVKDYDNENRAFKGFSEGRATINQSVGLPVGTYFYILNYTSVDGNGQQVTNKKDGYLYLTR
jgi:gliding motility-associated-like protein/uncharacterized repeat protein (TIGR01451 family)